MSGITEALANYRMTLRCDVRLVAGTENSRGPTAKRRTQPSDRAWAIERDLEHQKFAELYAGPTCRHDHGGVDFERMATVCLADWAVSGCIANSQSLSNILRNAIGMRQPWQLPQLVA